MVAIKIYSTINTNNLPSLYIRFNIVCCGRWHYSIWLDIYTIFSLIPHSIWEISCVKSHYKETKRLVSSYQLIWLKVNDIKFKNLKLNCNNFIFTVSFFFLIFNKPDFQRNLSHISPDDHSTMELVLLQSNKHSCKQLGQSKIMCQYPCDSSRVRKKFSIEHTG